jgi:hypothetical protein
MNSLLKNYQCINFLIICIIYVFHTLWHVDAVTDRYFFNRDLESHKLRFDYNNTWDRCSEKKDPACLKPTSYSSSSVFSSVYQVLEYRDYFNNRELILNKTNNSSFTVFDSKNQIRYLIYNGTSKPLDQISDELDNVQLSIVYSTDVLFNVPHANLYAMIAAALAILMTALAMISVFWSMCNSMDDDVNDLSMCLFKSWKYLLNHWHLPWVLWMLSFIIFLATTLIRIVAIESQVDGWSIALISTMADWSSTGFIIWIITLMLVRKQKADDILSEPELNENPTRLNLIFLTFVLILLSAPLWIQVIIFHSLDVNIFGPDDVSLQTGYSYLSTLATSVDRIRWFM